MSKDFLPVIIIGAPRSGTNMLRDMFSAQPDFATWPCDEINYIWRYGNSGFPTDELTPGLITPAIETYIRRQFFFISRKYGSRHVVEKTCANCLRLEFVDTLFPEALYINIIRDGRDAVSSALKRWRAPLNIPYILKKVRFVPAKDIPFYALRYLKSHLHRLLFSKEKSLSVWGPKFRDYRDFVREKPLVEVCGWQWLSCVRQSREVFEKRIESKRYFRVRYEDFVQNPVVRFIEILDYFGFPYEKNILRQESRRIRQNSVGKWETDLNSQQKALLSPLLKEELFTLGYK